MKLSNMKIFVALAVLLVASAVSGQTKIGGSKLFVAPMPEGLDQFIVAEILKQKLPVTLVNSQADADFVLTGAAQMTGTRDKGNGSLVAPLRQHMDYSGVVSLNSVKTNSVVWASDSDSGKVKDIAEKLVRQMKKDLLRK